jgi:hypothetical protein
LLPVVFVRSLLNLLSYWGWFSIFFSEPTERLFVLIYDSPAPIKTKAGPHFGSANDFGFINSEKSMKHIIGILKKPNLAESAIQDDSLSFFFSF